MIKDNCTHICKGPSCLGCLADEMCNIEFLQFISDVKGGHKYEIGNRQN
jgi:hypothetical protein